MPQLSHIASASQAGDACHRSASHAIERTRDTPYVEAGSD